MRNILIKTDTLINLFFSLIIFFLTIYLIPFFQTDSDLLRYRNIYNLFYSDFLVNNFQFDLQNLSIWGDLVDTKKEYYSQNLTSKEIIHFLIISFFSSFIKYEIYLSILNFIFAYSIIFYLRSIKISYSIIAILIFSNYYLYILYFSAERLKVALIFLIWVLFFKNIKLLSIFFLSLTFLSHFQTLLFLPIFFTKKLKFFLINLFLHFKVSILNIVGFPIICLIIYFFAYDHIIYKFTQQSFFMNTSILNDIIKLFLFYILTFFYSKDKFQLTLIFFIFFSLILVFSGSRIIIFVFFVSTFILFKNNKGLNLGFLTISLYYLCKTLIYLYIVFNCGATGWTLSECNSYLQNI